MPDFSQQLLQLEVFANYFKLLMEKCKPTLIHKLHRHQKKRREGGKILMVWKMVGLKRFVLGFFPPLSFSATL